MKPNVVLQRLRRHRKRIDREPNRFEGYRDRYEAIFVETKAIGGDDVVGDLLRWITEETEAARRLPEPTTVRNWAFERCRQCGYSIPEDSVLAGQP